MPLPDWYTEGAPRLNLGTQLYIDAFWELSTERDFGYSLGPIPWSKIMLYADRIGLNPTMCDVFLLVMRELESHYNEYTKNKQK